MKHRFPSCMADLSRRRFVQGLALGGAAAGLGLLRPSSAWALTSPDQPTVLGGSDFTLDIADTPVNVTGATTYTLKGQPSSLAAVLAGDMVVAIGPAMSGVTTSVTASHVWIGTLHNLIWHLAVIQHREAVERHHR